MVFYLYSLGGKKMIKNLVFDLGNVLLGFDPEKLVQKYILEPDRAKLVFENIFKSDEWIELDRGTIKEQEAIRKMTNRMPDEAEIIKEIFDNWPSILIPISENISILKELRKLNINIYVLSNFHQRAYEIMLKQQDFFKAFDGGIVSCYVKQVKPELDIYKTLLSKYNILPEETLFIDDMFVNIAAAKQLGIYTIHYKNTQDFLSKLKEFGVMAMTENL